MTEHQPASAAQRHTRRELLRLAGIGAVALGASSILSYSGAPATRFPAPRRQPIPDLRSGARVVYSTHTPETVTAVLQRYLQAFPKEHVELVQLGAADAVRRVLDERSDPVADVWIHAHVADLIDLSDKGALRSFRSDEGARVAAQHRDEEGRWYTVGLRPQVIAYNRRILGQANVRPPASVLDLGDRTWRSNYLGDWQGEAVVGLPDPTQPATFTWLSWMFAVLGAEEGSKFLKTLHDQGAGIPGSAGDLLEAMAGESYAIGPVEAPQALARLAQGDKALDIAYVEQDPKGRLPGAWMSATAVTLVSESRAARDLMDFLLSAEAARGFVQQGFEFPARPDIAVPDTHRVPAGGLRSASQPVREVVAAADAVRAALQPWGL